MPNTPADHFVITGPGVEAVIDLSAIAGGVAVSLTVDGVDVPSPTVSETEQGIVVQGVVEQVPDDHTLVASMTVPQANLAPDTAEVSCAGFAVLVTIRTSIGGPRLVTGPLQLFELRPLAVTASAVQSVAAES